MNSKAMMQAGQAVAATLLRRTLLKFLYIISGAGIVIIVILIILMTSLSGWWGVLLPLGLIVLAVGVMGLIATNFVIDRVNPRKLTSDERQQITSFVDDMNEKIVAGAVIKRNPMMIAAAAAWAYFRKGKDGAAQSVLNPIEQVKDLRTRFYKIVELFSDKDNVESVKSERLS
ncbi:MAG: hypothetical protein M3Q70_01685 [bacterium]|nr:hypothetical protein [bacterium]